jgi:hypothetical protein
MDFEVSSPMMDPGNSKQHPFKIDYRFFPRVHPRDYPRVSIS